jgi:hypothetical protein
MIMPLSTTMDNSVLNEIFGGTNWTPPTNLYLGLSTTAPAKDGTGVTEPSGNGYQRVQILQSVGNWPNAASSSKSNGGTFTFPQATGTWGSPSYWVVYDFQVGGSGAFIAYGAITTPKAIGSGDTPSFAASGLTITMS